MEFRGKNQRFRRRSVKLQAAGVSGAGTEHGMVVARPHNVSLADRAAYQFDNILARGAVALMGLLAILSLLIIVLASAVVALTRVQPSGVGFLELLYRSLLHTIDTGTVGGDTGSPWFLLVMVLTTVGGIFIVSALIGVITTGLDNKLAEMRRGRSQVLETGHTLILGWSPQVFTIISELVIANENQRRPRIVVLAPRDKVEMEEEVRSKVPDTKNTRVVCRTGHPLDLSDLEIGNPRTARSIIILAPQIDDPDTHVIMTLLAITNHPQRRPEPYHIVAQIRDPKNLKVAEMVGRDEAQLILTDDLIARITVQTCRQSGLSVVYTELLDFDGDEIYFQEEPGLVGKSFADALLAYEESAIIGLQRASGATRLNPAMDSRIEVGDKVIAISEDDDTVRLGGVDPIIDADAIQARPVLPASPEQTLILGWNSRLPTIVRELDHYVSAGSNTTIVTTSGRGKEELEPVEAGIENQTLAFQQGDPSDRSLLDRLHLSNFQHVIVLTDSDNGNPEEADARTLITLLHLRDIQENGTNGFSIVSEMQDIRNRELAEVTHADDFVVSEQLVSLMMSQVSENPDLNAVFADLFDADGSEIYLKPVEQYVRLGQPVNFYTIVEAARRRAEVAIGYRQTTLAGDSDAQYGVKVNPRKSDLVTFEQGDKIIVVAED